VNAPCVVRKAVIRAPDFSTVRRRQRVTTETPASVSIAWVTRLATLGSKTQRILEEAREGFPAHLVGITVAEPTGAEPADMSGRLEQDDLGAFPGRGDRGAEAPGRRAVDDDVGLPGLGRSQEDGQKGEAARAPHPA